MIDKILKSAELVDKAVSKRKVHKIDPNIGAISDTYDSVAIAAAILGISKKRLRQIIRKGELFRGYRWTFAPK